MNRALVTGREVTQTPIFYEASHITKCGCSTITVRLVLSRNLDFVICIIIWFPVGTTEFLNVHIKSNGKHGKLEVCVIEISDLAKYSVLNNPIVTHFFCIRLLVWGYKNKQNHRNTQEKVCTHLVHVPNECIENAIFIYFLQIQTVFLGCNAILSLEFVA